MNGLRRALKRLYGSSTLGDTNNPSKSMSTVAKLKTSVATRGRPKSAGVNKTEKTPNKGKSTKDYSSEDIFRRSLGGADRSGLVNRVLTKSASSSLATSEDILLTNIKANAGHGIKLLESITATDIVEGDIKATGVLLGLVYQEWYRLCVLDKDGSSRAMEMMAFLRSPSPTGGRSSRSSSPISSNKKGASSGRRASVFQPSGGFNKDPRTNVTAPAWFPLKFQNDPKMRERETMYIVSLYEVDPLRAAKLEEEKLAQEHKLAKIKKQKRAEARAREREEKRRQQSEVGNRQPGDTQELLSD